MKIEFIEPILAGSWLYVRIGTDTGLVGNGEGGLWTYPAAAKAVLDGITPYLLGKDPLAIEHHWQYVYRNNHFRGSAIHAALSAIDIALWDIAGKRFDVPVYQLLGGPTRHKIRLYVHVAGDTPNELAAAAARAVADGFTAVRFDPFLLGGWPISGASPLVSAAVDRVAAVREKVGPDVDIAIDVHNKLRPSDALEVGRALQPFRLLFMEDPIPPESPVSMGQLAQRMPVTIATGERLQTLEEFRDLMASGFVGYIRPDLCLAGITQSKKIAALAEAWHVGVIPHNWLSPISTAACLQLDAAIPNFVLQEYTGEDTEPKSRLLTQPLRREGGYLRLPDRPGIGADLDQDYVRSLPFTTPALDTPIRDDGSVAEL